MTWLMVLKGDRFKEKRPRHHSSVNPNKTFLCIHVVVNFFLLGNFSFSFVSTSLAYITILKNKRKTKIT